MPHDPDFAFFVEMRPKLMGYVRRRYPGFPRMDVEDAVQEAFMRHLAYRHETVVANATAHLYMLAGWVAANTHRQRKSEGCVISGPDGESVIDRIPGDPPPPPVDPAELAVFLIIDWLGHHRPNDVELFELRVQGLSHEEIAGRLGLAVTAERKRSSRLTQELRRHFSELGIDECLKALTDGGNST
jgi:DNA-directed RNA polymerase specialized sigma24 family protein